MYYIAFNCMLTFIIFAYVQWTISSELPVSDKDTWLAQLSNICILFSALVCVEGYVVGYLEGKAAARSTHKLHFWVEAAIKLSLLQRSLGKLIQKKILLRMFHASAAATVSLGEGIATQVRNSVSADNDKSGKNGDSGGGGGIGGERGVNGITKHSSSPVFQHQQQKKMNAQVDIEGGGVELSENPLTINNKYTNKHNGNDSSDGGADAINAVTDGTGGAFSTPDHSDQQRYSTAYSNSNNISIYGPEAGVYSWAGGASAVDHICRILFPLVFTIVLLVFTLDAAAA